MTLFLLLRLLVVAWWLTPDPDGRGPRTLGPYFSALVRRLYAGLRGG